MSGECVRKALEECAEDVRADSEAQEQPEREPVIPLVHSYEQTADAASFWMRKFRARRASGKDHPGQS